MQLLTTSGWLPTVSLENVFVAIRSESLLCSVRDLGVSQNRDLLKRSVGKTTISPRLPLVFLQTPNTNGSFSKWTPFGWYLKRTGI